MKAPTLLRQLLTAILFAVFGLSNSNAGNLSVAYSGSSDQAVILSFLNEQTVGSNLVGTLQIDNASGTWAYLEQDFTLPNAVPSLPSPVLLLGPGEIKTFPNFSFPKGDYLTLNVTTPLGLDYTQPSDKLTALAGALLTDLIARGLLCFSLPPDTFDGLIDPSGVVDPLMQNVISTFDFGDLSNAIVNHDPQGVIEAIAALAAQSDEVKDTLTPLLAKYVTSDQIDSALDSVGDLFSLPQRVALLGDLTGSTFAAAPYSWSRIDIVTQTQVPSISTVSPSVLMTMPVSQTQTLTIYGTGFTSSTSLVFKIGNATYSSQAQRLRYIDPYTLQYDIAVGSAMGTWTVAPTDGLGSANFQVVNGSSGSFTITPTSDSHGSISPNTRQTKAGGESQTFIATPQDSTFTVDSWYVDGAVVPNVGNTFTLANIQASHVVYVTFKPVAQLIGLSIAGPATVNENSTSVPFTVQENFSDNSTETVAPISWSWNPSNVITISPSGILTAGSVSSDTMVTISATYTDGAVTLSSSPMNVTIKNVAPAASGSIQVTLAPQGAISAGAMWSLDGQTWLSSGTSVGGLLGSNYSVYFKGATGWTAPATQTASVSSGSTTQVTGQYTQPTQAGSLEVFLFPTGAINAGAQWQVDGGAWQNSAAVVTGLNSATSHAIAFKPIPGWVVPATANVNITTNANNVLPAIQATYTQSSTGNGSSSGTGSVQITLAPLGAATAGARWSIYPNVWQDNGDTVSNIAPGIYTVTFRTPPGYLAPTGTSTITVTAGQETQQTFTFPTQADWGSLIVDILPASAAQAGAQWTISGYPPQNSGAILQDLPAGGYQVEFTPVPGYVTPAGGWVYPAGHGTSIITGTYTPLPPGGAVQVLLQPQDAVVAGAQWRVDGGAWNDSGATVAGLSTSASHTIDYQEVDGWIGPVSQTISVSSDLTTTLDSYYSEDGSTPQIFTVTPPTGSMTGGTEVDITGANFGGNVNVDFGGVPATSVNVISSTEITAVAPPQTTGTTVSLEVSTGNGADIQTGGFTYGPNLGQNIQLDKILGGSVYAVDVLGTHAYVSQGATLVALDISNPGNPAPVGRLSLPYFVNHLSVYQGGDGRTYVAVAASIYVAGATNGVLQIVDVTDPTSPLLMSTLTTGGAATDVKVLAGLAYVCDGYNGLEIYDLTEPTNPQLKGSLGNLGYCTNILLDVSANGVIAYVAEASGNSVEFVDVSDPTNPVHKGGYVHGIGWEQGICALAKSGNVLYVGPERQAMFVVDVTNLAAPTEISDITNSGFPAAMFVQGNRLYSITQTSVSTFDISNPASPARLFVGLISGYPVAPYVNDGALNGNYLFSAGTESGLSILNIANANSPSLAGTYQQACEYSISIYAPTSPSVIYSGTNTGVNIFSSASPSSAQWLAKAATTPAGGGGSGFAQQGNLLFDATTVGMFVLDVTNPGEPLIKGDFFNTVLDGGVGIDSLGQPVIAGFQTNPTTGAYLGAFLWTVNVSNPSNPTAYGSSSIATATGVIRNVVVNGNYAYIADLSDQSHGLSIFDLSNPSSPQEIGSVATPPLAYWVAVSSDGQTAYVANAFQSNANPGELTIVDVSNPHSPTIVGSILSGGNVRYVSVSGNRLVVCSYGVHVFDISNPRQPVEIGNYATPGNCNQAVMVDNQIYVADGYAGVDILTLKDYTAPTVAITNPTAVATYTTNNTAITVGGVAADDTGVVSVVWSNNRGGAGNATGLTSWVTGNISLQPGDNVITVTGFDAAGNAGNDTITVHSNAVVQASQTISFGNITDQTFGAGNLTLSATSSSGLSITYQVVSGPATLTSNTLSFTGPGAVVISATQDGNGSFLAAPSVQQIFNVLPSAQQITFQPISTLMSGGNVVLSAAASSGLPVTFIVLAGPGQVDGNQLEATGLGTIVVQASQSGDVNNQAANPVVQSVVVQSAPMILVQPSDQTASLSDPVVFSIEAAATPAPTYQWYKNGQPISNATSPVLVIGQAAATDAGNYSVTVTNEYDSAASNIANLKVNNGGGGGTSGQAPSITKQPGNLTIAAGGSAAFNVTAVGGGNLLYQWKFNGTAIKGATKASYTIAKTTVANTGNYTVFVSNASGYVTSQAAILTIDTLSAIITSPASSAVTAGPNVTATFTITATGNPTPSVQWQSAPAKSTTFSNLSTGGNFSGVTSANLTVSTPDASLSGTQFRAVATNVIGNTTYTAISKVATLTVNLPPSIISLSATGGNQTLNSLLGGNLTVSAGTSVTFSANATGTALKYQWLFNGVNIKGATKATYTIAKAAVASAGNYTVSVSNAFIKTSATADPFTLTVLTPPAIVTPLKATPAKPTTNPILKVVASGNPVPTFSWTFSGCTTLPNNIFFSNTTNISPATSILNFTNATISDTGTYKVIITNSQSPPTPLSSSAKLTVK
jgi:hypothetical protein